MATAIWEALLPQGRTLDLLRRATIAPGASFIMLLILAFSVALLVAVLLSKVASQTVLSTAVIFLAAGFLLGRGALDVIQVKPTDQSLSNFVEIALFGVLFADGLKIGVHELLAEWKLPGRALLLGLPLTVLFIAILATLTLRIGWLPALLLGAILSPTDPVFAKALVSRREVPVRLRHLLNVESGLNDGLALPLVLLMLSLLGKGPLDIAQWLFQLAIGTAVGIGVPWAVSRLERLKLFSTVGVYKPLLGISIAFLVFSCARLLQGNLFLAGFSAGITLATVNGRARDAVMPHAELTAELLKVASILLLGVFLSVNVLVSVGLTAYLFAVLVLFIARPLALALALLGSPLSGHERLAAAWFGPRGFASVVYGLLLLQSNVRQADSLFRIVAVVVLVSIVLDSTTDVPVAHWFGRMRAAQAAQQQPPGKPDAS